MVKNKKLGRGISGAKCVKAKINCSFVYTSSPSESNRAEQMRTRCMGKLNCILQKVSHLACT
jgi:hypothetical protein